MIYRYLKHLGHNAKQTGILSWYVIIVYKNNHSLKNAYWTLMFSFFLIQCDQKFSDDSKSLLRANGYIFFQNSNCRTNLEVAHFYFWFNLLNVIDSFFAVRDFATSVFFESRAFSASILHFLFREVYMRVMRLFLKQYLWNFAQI